MQPKYEKSTKESNGEFVQRVLRSFLEGVEEYDREEVDYAMHHLIMLETGQGCDKRVQNASALLTQLKVELNQEWGACEDLISDLKQVLNDFVEKIGDRKQKLQTLETFVEDSLWFALQDIGLVPFEHDSFSSCCECTCKACQSSELTFANWKS